MSLRGSTMRSIAVLIVSVGWSATALPASGDEVDFTRDVRPLLARHCFKCHGPDEKARKADLRLDVRDAALKGGASGDPAIVPGKLHEGELLRRLLSDDEDEVMPPPSAKLPL